MLFNFFNCAMIEKQSLKRMLIVKFFPAYRSDLVRYIYNCQMFEECQRKNIRLAPNIYCILSVIYVSKNQRLTIFVNVE